MPKIDAETVQAHRDQQVVAIMAAAHSLLQQHGPAAVTPGAIASEIGLTRTAIYKYFSSAEDILSAIVDNAFSAWHDAVSNAVEAAMSTPEKVDAYVQTTLSLGADGAHRLAILAAGSANDEASNARLTEQHRKLSTPLAAILELHGTKHGPLVATLIDGLLRNAIAQIEAGVSVALVTFTARNLVIRALDLPHSDQPEEESHDRHHLQ